MNCKQVNKHLFSAIAFVCMIAVADNQTLEPSKNEFKIVSPVPSGSTVEMITQAPRLDTLQGKTIALVGGSLRPPAALGLEQLYAPPHLHGLLYLPL